MQLLLELSKLKEEQTERQNEKLESDRRLNSALEEERLSINDLQWYRSIKSELAKSKIPVEDISKLVNSELYTKIQNMLYSGLYLAEILEHFHRYFFTSIENELSNYLHLLSTLAFALSLSIRQSVEPQSRQASNSSSLALTSSSEEAEKPPMHANQT